MKLAKLVADFLRRGLAKKERRPATVRRDLELPLVECAHEARPGEEMTPERVAGVLLDEEANVYQRRREASSSALACWVERSRRRLKNGS
jgi:hypothetical protein